MKSGTIGIWSRKIDCNWVAIACCFFESSVTFHLFKRPVACALYVCDQLPVVETTCPEGISGLCGRWALRYLYGDGCERFCQSSVALLVADPFGYHEFQSGSTLTVES